MIISFFFFFFFFFFLIYIAAGKVSCFRIAFSLNVHFGMSVSLLSGTSHQTRQGRCRTSCIHPRVMKVAEIPDRIVVDKTKGEQSVSERSFLSALSGFHSCRK